MSGAAAPLTQLPSQASEATVDTVKITFGEFTDIAMKHSANLEARRKNVSLAENRIRQAQSNRLLPDLNLTTAHGLVPGVTSQDPDITPGSYYLDPNLENDWEDWGIFTQADVSGIQPVYTWGAIGNLVNAAKKGAEAARHKLDAEKESFELQLFELYQSALLVSELDRLVADAQDQLATAEEELEAMREEGDPSIEDKDVFEFYIFKAEFQAMVTEAQQTRDFVRRSWNMVLASGPETLYLPAERFFDPVPVTLQDFGFYENNARHNRSELRGLRAASQAAGYGAEALRAQYYPSLVIGLSAGFGYTPNRPRQNNPYIRNNTNFLSARIGFGFRQNLNFWQLRTRVARSEIQKSQVDDFHDAAMEGILIELSDRYREARIAESRHESKQNALSLSNEWLRTEQIDFDIGFGDIENLVDAVKKKMELELEVSQLTFDLNLKMARLYRSAGIPLHEMIPAVSAR
ncbi:MAG: TolC family protein [Cyclonatronaceae bacterium]